MGTLSNNNSGGQQRHDGQKNYQHSNQRNPDNVRNNTRDHEYKDYDEALTNDVNFKEGKMVEGVADFEDTQDNVKKGDQPKQS